MKYIQNRHNALVKCKIVDTSSPAIAGSPVYKEFIFRPEVLDRQTGRFVESGYTQVSDEDYAALKENSAVFKSFTSEDKNLLIVHDELPNEVKTPQNIIVELRTKISELTAEVQELTAANSELEKQVVELTEQLMTATAGSSSASSETTEESADTTTEAKF